ncbi:Hsp20/alpha crystallin family protein [Catenulispora subtropica]|uniref:Hsp20/alpha crystallin family protein n=1 Tax=Catenulispora subtropica TaxID=450798 RepID=A0ABN2R7L1_9ACTN
MLMRTDPFRDLDRIAAQLLGTTAAGTWTRPNPMPLDAWREGDEFVVCFDLPGVSLDAIDVDIERNVLTVKAERRPTATGETKVEISERPLGVFSRQLFLGDTLDADNIKADYDAGVLTLRIPVAEKAKPRKVEITASGDKKAINA